MFLLDIEKRVRDYKKVMISEDEEITTERHRRWITFQGEHRVIHAVPIANERIDKTENQAERNNCRR